MNCNQCPYMNGGKGGVKALITQVQGNNFSLMIPMTSVLVNNTNGKEQRDDRSFPIFDVQVWLVRNIKKYECQFTVSTNVIIVREPGQLPVGTYDIVITYRGTDGQKYRYKQLALLEIIDAAVDGGEYENSEVDVITHYPTIRGRVSAINISDTEVSITEGQGYTGDTTPNDNFADMSAEYGDNVIVITEDEVIITI